MAVLRLMTNSYLVGCLHRQVGGLLALENAVDVGGRTPEQIYQVGPVRHQAASLDEEAVGINCGQLVLRGERDDPIALNRRDGATGRSGRRSDDPQSRPPHAPFRRP